MADLIVSESLDNLLKGSRLSMNQIAGKWGVSAPLLSQIKNGKKKPSLELGLKILRESGATLEDRKRWMEERNAEGHELGRIYKDERKERVEFSLRKNIGELFESSPVLLDLFLDISLMKDKGLSWNGVFKNYGEYGLELSQTLIETGLVKKEGDRYFIVQDELTHTIDTENSLGIMKSVFESLKQKHKRDGFRGEFHFDLNDVSPQGYQQLKQLNVEYTRKMVAIIKENEMPRVRGGLRIVAQNLVSMLKCFVLLFVVAQGVDSTHAQGSGVSGGGSGKIVDSGAINIKELKRVLTVNSAGIGYPGRTPRALRIRDRGEHFELKYQTAAFLTPYFATEEAAVESVVELNKVLEHGNFGEKEATHIARNLPNRCKDWMGGGNSNERRAMAKAFTQEGTIKPLGFKIHNSYTADGKPRFSAIAGFYIPCVVEKN
jgi:transcriptional regulator with XRE-family HTH domain